MNGTRGRAAEGTTRPSVLTIRRQLMQLRELLTDDPHGVRARCVSLEQASERLQLPVAVVALLVDRGELLSITIGDAPHIPCDELEVFAFASKPWALPIPPTAKPREVLTIILRALHRATSPLSRAQTARRMSERFPPQATPAEVLDVLIAATRRR